MQVRTVGNVVGNSTNLSNFGAAQEDGNVPSNEGVGITDKVFTDQGEGLGEKSVIEGIEKANKIMINHNTRAEFSVHRQTKTIMVKIIDTDSNEVIREIPPEKILDMVAKFVEMAGLIVDERR